MTLLADAIQRVGDDVRSINSSRTIEASSIKAEHLHNMRRLLRVYFGPFDDTAPEVVLHAHVADVDYEW